MKRSGAVVIAGAVLVCTVLGSLAKGADPNTATPVFSVLGGTYHSEQHVTISCATPGATIHYTTNGVDPTESDPVITSGGSILVDRSMILKARAWKEAMTPSAVASVTYTLVVATPTFSKAGGTYHDELMIEISCATPGATIRYTLDGSDPNDGVIYDPGTPVYVDRTLTLKAKAWKGELTSSMVQSATYTLIAATPTFSKAGGTYYDEFMIELSCATPGAMIHYTTNGVDPTESDPAVVSGGSILVDRSMILKARAWKGDLTPSMVQSATYTLIVATPVFTPDGGAYSENQTVTVTCPTPGATIYYTTDGSDPTVDSLVVENGGTIPVSVDPATVLKAKAYKENLQPSGIKRAIYHLAGVIYVNAAATGANTGLNWADAFTDLQSALDAADPNSNMEIWVAAGTYKPTKEVGGTGSRYRSFQLKNGVGVYGGFNGTETDRDQRDWELNKTILSGDLNGNDNDRILESEPRRQDNCYHVFNHFQLYLDASAVLDGFVITGGNANEYIRPHFAGGGMCNYDQSNPTIVNCTFVGNSAMHIGGGMYNGYRSNPSISHCLFDNNSANHGGGMYNYDSSPKVVDCSFNRNRVFSDQPACTVFGAGMCNMYSNPLIVNCIFVANSANSAFPEGGAIHNYFSSPAIINCIFSGNSAGKGGGIFNNYSSNPNIINSILWGNTATYGPQMYNINGNYKPPAPVVSYSNIEGGWAGDGNIDTDPKFRDVLSGDYRLQADSPCLDTGRNDAVPTDITTDLDGNLRIIDSNGDGSAVVDMGAYEFVIPADAVLLPSFTPSGGLYAAQQAVTITCETPGAVVRYTTNGAEPNENDPIITPEQSVLVDSSLVLKARAWKDNLTASVVRESVYEVAVIIYVNASATGANTGTSWKDAFTDLQSALDAADANSNTEIWVAAGTYKPSREVGGTGSRYRSFQLKNNVGVYGGFRGTEVRREQRNWQLYATILSGDLNDNDNSNIACDEPARQDNCYRVFYHPEGLQLDATAILDGCIVTGGNANDALSVFDCGGGMYNDKLSSPTITNCTFIHNSADSGGGLANGYASNPIVIHCHFISNTAANSGGGIANWDSTPLFVHCDVIGNSAKLGGGMYNDGNSQPMVANSILWGNTAGTGLQIYNGNNAVILSVIYSAIQGGWTGEGNIDAAPLFVNAANGDLRLQAGSPCIDKGSNAAVPAGVLADLVRTPRIVDGNCDGNAVVDMGAYEYLLPGDLNTTCSVDMDDLSLFSPYWLAVDCISPDNCGQADIDRNGVVELADFAILAGRWMED